MQSLKSRVHYFLAALLLPAGALLASGAGAQQGAVLEEVIVTAEKREQNIQDLPISIEAFDAERLETLQIDGFQDISQHVPGLYDGPNSADVGGVKIYIRGVGTGDPQVGLDSRLALYVDGIYVGKTPGLAFDAVDLERVEVLKGPQGTLYGRNAVAGAINLISKKADPSEFDAQAAFTVGNYSALKFKGHVNVPISDQLAVKVGAYLSEVDGWVENKGAGEDFAGHEREGVRLDVAYIHNDQMRFDYSYEYTDSENQPLFYQSVPGTAQPFPWNYARYLAAPPPSGKRQDDVNANFGPDVRNGEIETEAHTLLGRWDWSDNHYAKLLVGWREVKATRFNVFYPEVNRDCLNANTALDSACINRNASGQPINNNGDVITTGPGVARTAHFNTFVDNLLFTQPTLGDPRTWTNTELLSRSVAAGDEYLVSIKNPDRVSLAGDSGAADTLMDPAESWSVELNQIGTLLDGRLEYTAGLYYFKEEIKNESSPNPFGFFGLATGSAASMGAYQATFNRLVREETEEDVCVENGGTYTAGECSQAVTGAQIGQYVGGLAAAAGRLQRGAPEAGDQAKAQAFGAHQAGMNAAAAAEADRISLTGITNAVELAQYYSQATLINARSGTNPVNFELDTEAWAIFGQFTYTPEGFDDRLHITVGARYSKDEKEAKLQPAFIFAHSDEGDDTVDATIRSKRPQTLVAAVNAANAGLIAAGHAAMLSADIDPFSDDNDYDSFDPMVRAVWDLDENSIVYGSVTRGFLSGGYNLAAGTLEGGFDFDKQNILAYEVGYKGELLDRRLRVNAAAFYYEMDDDQTADSNPTDPTSRSIANVDTEFEGAEISVTYAINEELTVNLQYAYLDTEVDPYISDYNQSQQTYDHDDDPNTAALPLRSEIRRTATGAPENTVNITVDYNTSLAKVLPWLGDGEFHAHLGYSHVDESFGSNRNPRDQQDLFNAEVGFSMPHETGTLRVSLWAQNLFDNKYIVDSLVTWNDRDTSLYLCSNPQGDPCGTAQFIRKADINRPTISTGGYDTVIYGEPRTYGLTVAWDYE